MMRTGDKAAAGAGVVGAGLGLMALAGWLTGNMALVRLYPAFVPMQVDSALELMLCGVGLALLAAGRQRAGAAFGALAGALGLAAFPLHAVGLEGFSSALPEAFRLEPASALCAALAGGALFWAAWRPSGRSRALLGLAGALLAAFGIVASFCYLRGMTAAFGWEGLMRIPAGSAAGYALLGLGFLAVGAGEDGDSPAWEARLPMLIGVGAAAAALCLWLALDAEQSARIRWTVGGAAEELKGRLESVGDSGRLEKALREDKLFGQVLPGSPPRTYGFAVFIGNREAYSSTPPSPYPLPRGEDARRAGEGYARDVEVFLGGTAWRVRVWPSAELLAAHRSLLPAAVFGVGLLFAALLALSAHLALLARRQSRLVEEQRREAEAASGAKSRFLANISREMTNPLNSILGFSSLLLGGRSGALNPDQSEDLLAVLKGGQCLAELAGQLLDLARLEAGALRLSREPVPAARLLEEVRAAFAGVALRKGLTLEVEGDVPPAAVVLGDAARLRQALGAILDNSLKFTHRGKVTLGLLERDADVVFVIRDTGLGISSDEKEKIFEPFWQSERLARIKKAEGLGLGLHLAKRIVEQHGGRVSAQGQEGAGSAVFVSLPRVNGGKQ